MDVFSGHSGLRFSRSDIEEGLCDLSEYVCRRNESDWIPQNRIRDLFFDALHRNRSSSNQITSIL